MRLTFVLLLLLGSGCAPAPAPPTPLQPQPTPTAAAPARHSTTADLGADARAALAAIPPLATPAHVRLALSPQVLEALPLFLAVDQGYFKQLGLDVEVIKYSGSSTTQLPLLVRGDIDVAQAATAPALFNQARQGFGLKLIAALGQPRPGRQQTAWLTLLADQESGIRELADLRGHTIDGGAGPGTPISLLVAEALDQAHLDPTRDVTLQYRAKTPPDMLVLAQNKAADVLGMNEPTATQAEKRGLVVRWKSMAEIAPWYQSSPLAVSAGLLESNRAAVQKLLEAYLIAARQVNATNGAWTDPLLSTATSWTGYDASVVQDQGGPAYYQPNGTIALDALSRIQDRWVAQGEVQQRVDSSGLVDQQVLADALAEIGRAPEP